MNQKIEEFFNVAEAAIVDHDSDILLESKLGPNQTYLIAGTSKALLILAKKICEDVLEKKNTQADRSVHTIGSLGIEILNLDRGEIEKLRSVENRKARRLGLNTLLVVPFWALAAYGSYTLFIRLAGIM